MSVVTAARFDGFVYDPFEEKLASSLVKVRQLLEQSKHPVLAGDSEANYHCYHDKYMLAEFVNNASIAASVNILLALGLTQEDVKKVVRWSQGDDGSGGKSITIRLQSEEKCKFNREVRREEDSKTKSVSEVSSGNVTLLSVSSKVVTTISEYYWDFEISYSLEVYRGTGEDPGDHIQFRQRQANHEIMTTVKDSPPRPSCVIRPTMEAELTWLFKHLDKDTLSPTFFIDRTHEKCHTPRRNVEVDEALKLFDQLCKWCQSVSTYFRNEIFAIPLNHGLDLRTITDESVFVPVLPLFQKRPKDTVLNIDWEPSAVVPVGTNQGTIVTQSEATAAVLPPSTLNLFLNEQCRTLNLKCEDMKKIFPDGEKSNALISSEEASMLVILRHCTNICRFNISGVEYIEELLLKQVVAAIGREVTPVDLCEYMKFHNNKIFKLPYRPRPFCYAVRRTSDHSPEGVLSLEEIRHDGYSATVISPASSNISDPIYTLVHHEILGETSPATTTDIDDSKLMSFSLSASTEVKFGGDRYLHGWLHHAFSGINTNQLSLAAEARQFSSFIILVGRVTSATTFDPKYAMIVKDKDSVRVPLDLEMIPSAKEFKNAISSLSPEQQKFAKAFRGMQLESTMFGICVIQIKPQLEKVLKLLPDSLTKEIKLTQNLMELFIEYQIPSDLLSFDGNENADRESRLNRVKQLVTNIQELIKGFKDKEIDEVKQKALYNVASKFAGDSSDDESELCDDNDDYNEVKEGSDYYEEEEYCEDRCFDAPFMEKGESLSPMATPKNKATPPAKRETSPVKKAAKPPGTPTLEQHAEVNTKQLRDYTKIPSKLDEAFNSKARGSTIRPTIIRPGEIWKRRRQTSLLSNPIESSIADDDLKTEKNMAFDLLDALTKSGGLSIDNASFHVVIAATHIFDKTIMNTIVQDNINPIEKVEKATVIMAMTIHDTNDVNQMLVSDI